MIANKTGLTLSTNNHVLSACCMAHRGSALRISTSAEGCPCHFLQCPPRALNQYSIAQWSEEVVSLPNPMALPCPRSRPHLLLADDHAIFLEALKCFLQKSYVVTGTVTDGRSLVTEAIRNKPDIIILDVGMPLLNGLDAARRIREQLPSIRIVFLTMQENAHLAAAALELGHTGFVLKHAAAGELVTAIEQVWRGESYISPKLQLGTPVEHKTQTSRSSKNLTPRQRDIVQLFAEGYGLKEIAERLNLSLKTIEFHKHHIMTEFSLKSNADLVLLAVKKGLISINPEIRYANGKVI
jgi:DNA-binding NarL/FixJ family response regulator